MALLNQGDFPQSNEIWVSPKRKKKKTLLDLWDLGKAQLLANCSGRSCAKDRAHPEEQFFTGTGNYFWGICRKGASRKAPKPLRGGDSWKRTTPSSSLLPSPEGSGKSRRKQQASSFIGDSAAIRGKRGRRRKRKGRRRRKRGE
eukprot:1160845-Pelagomonas_calceolata.AAC.1